MQQKRVTAQQRERERVIEWAIKVRSSVMAQTSQELEELLSKPTKVPFTAVENQIAPLPLILRIIVSALQSFANNRKEHFCKLVLLLMLNFMFLQLSFCVGPE